MFWRTNAGGRMLVLGISLVLAACPALASARTEEVLSWDDGEPDAYCGTPDVAKASVWFQAPEWATSVAAVHVWFGGEWAPICTVWLYRASGEWPYEPGPPASDGFVLGVASGGNWTVIPFPAPVDITDAGLFPDRVFFVGIEFETQSAEALGVDTDEPVDLKSMVFNWSVWELYEAGDIMIRAVVSDSTGSAVDVLSWGVLKHTYEGSRLPN